MASKLGKALGYDLDLGASEEAPVSTGELDEVSVEPEEKKPSGSAEVLAMKMFDSAKSPEDKVAAFKHLLEACGGY